MTAALRELPSVAGFGVAPGRAARDPRARPGRARHVELGSPAGASPGRDRRPVRREVTLDDAFRRLARSPGLGFGESYAAGDWHTDDLPGLIAILVRTSRHGARSRLARLDRHRPHVSPRQSLRKARREHPVPLRPRQRPLPALPRPVDDLLLRDLGGRRHARAAQARKLRRVCEMLELGPGDHVLEIGCGWGSFARLAAGEYGARVTGLTLSQRAIRLAWACLRGRPRRPVGFASGLPEARRPVFEDCVDRDAGSDRIRAVPDLFAASTGCSPPAGIAASR